MRNEAAERKYYIDGHTVRRMEAAPAGTMVFGIFTGAYIHIQSEMTARMNQISSLESQIADLKADNDEAYKRINTSVDLDSIRNTAMTEYGMSYAKESQIVYYTVNDDDYMNQYSEIPRE